jgi:multiple sugar transport system permease protein
LIRVLLGLVVVVLFALPLFWVIVASLRQPGLPPPRTVAWWPASPQWSNYARIFQDVPLARYALNSVLVVLVAVPVTLVTASWAALSMVQLVPSWRRVLLLLSVMLLMVPAPAVWLFRFQLLRWLGLLDSLGALIVPALAASSPLFVLLFYWSFRRLPQELFEAARLDGASALAVWWRVALPLVRPVLAGVTVLAFVMYWSDFASPVLYLVRPETYTLPVGLQILKQYDATNWPLLMAAAVTLTLPALLLFAVLQRSFLYDEGLDGLAGDG